MFILCVCMIELGWVVHKTYWNYLRKQMGESTFTSPTTSEERNPKYLRDLVSKGRVEARVDFCKFPS